MSEAMSDDHVYQVIVTVDVSSASIQVSCGGLAPQLVRVALELAADYMEDVSVWSIVAENAGAILEPAVQSVDDDDE